jgi:hypothetical protein
MTTVPEPQQQGPQATGWRVLAAASVEVFPVAMAAGIILPTTQAHQGWAIACGLAALLSLAAAIAATERIMTITGKSLRESLMVGALLPHRYIWNVLTTTQNKRASVP